MAKTKSKERAKPLPSTSIFSEEVKVNLTGQGDLIDVRFIVKPEMSMLGPVYLQDESTKKIATVLGVPRVGALMTRKSKVNNCGYGVFLNPDECIKSGSQVTFVAGGYKKEHITVT